MKMLGYGAASILVLFTLVPTPSRARSFVYTTDLTSVPPGASPGTGFVEVDWDDAAHTMRVHGTFSGLFAPTTMAHIHATTATPGSESGGVVTQIPSLDGFPLGVTSGMFDHTYDLGLVTTYNPEYVNQNGGTAAGAEAALKSALDGERAYFNVHTTQFPLGGRLKARQTPKSRERP